MEMIGVKNVSVRWERGGASQGLALPRTLLHSHSVPPASKRLCVCVGESHLHAGQNFGGRLHFLEQVSGTNRSAMQIPRNLVCNSLSQGAQRCPGWSHSFSPEPMRLLQPLFVFGAGWWFFLAWSPQPRLQRAAEEAQSRGPGRGCFFSSVVPGRVTQSL